MSARVIPVGNVASPHTLGIIVADNAKIIVCYWAQFTREFVGRYDVRISGDFLFRIKQATVPRWRTAENTWQGGPLGNCQKRQAVDGARILALEEIELPYD